jgi:hypothetical protein
MKRYGLLVAALVIVIFTLLLLTHSKAFAKRPRRSSLPRSLSAVSADPLCSISGRRWLSGEPTHWHALLVQR